MLASINNLFRSYKHVKTIIGHIPIKWVVSVVLNSLQTLIANFSMGLAIMLTLDGITEQSNCLIYAGLIALSFASLYLVFILPVLSKFQDTQLARMRFALSNKLFDNVVMSSTSDTDVTHSGTILTLFENDITEVLKLFDWTFIGLIQALLSGIFALGATFAFSLQIGVFILLSSIVLFCSSMFFTSSIRRATAKVLETHETRTKLLIDFLDNFVLLRLYKMMENILSLISDAIQRKYSSEIFIYNRQNLAQVIVSVITNLMFFSGILVIGSIQVANETLTIGATMFLIQIANGAVFLFSYSGGYISSLQLAANATLRLKSFTDKCIIEDPENIESTDQHVENEDFVRIIVSNLCFRYNSEAPYVLNNVSAEIPAIRCTYIMGDNGSGKSTLLKLIMGAISPSSGKIVFDSPNTNRDRSILLKFVSLVPQNPFIFCGTLLDNITFGEYYSDDDIAFALRVSELDDFVSQLPNRLKTLIEFDGKNLSAGQKQRISLARVLIQKPKILMLDEFTSHLDEATASKIIRNIEEKMPFTQLVIVTHNMSNVNIDQSGKVEL